MKKHSLVEHLRDVSQWRCDNFDDVYLGPYSEEPQILFWIAYERWLNDRELLTKEDKVALNAS